MLVLTRKSGESIVARNEMHPRKRQEAKQRVSHLADRGQYYCSQIVEELIAIVEAQTEITVLVATSGKIRLGIVAPTNVKIVRKELVEPGGDTPCVIDIEPSTSAAA